MLGAREPVFGEVNAPAGGDHELVQTIDDTLHVRATAMSTAMEVPSSGNDKSPSPSGPQSLITHNGDAPPSFVSRAMNSRTRGRAGRARQHALVLGEPARAVPAVPMEIASSG